MSKTIEAMKQAQYLLRWTQFGEYRTYQGPALEPRDVDKMLREAIAAEEAHDLPGNNGPLTPVGIAAAMMEVVDLMASDPASTKAVDPRTWHHLLVYAPKPAGERAELIEKLRWAAKVGGDSILHVGGADTYKQAADMLEADAQLTKLADVGREMVNITTTVMGEDEWPAIHILWLECMKERDDLRAQQVAVPQGLKLIGYYHLADDPDECEFFLSDAINGDCPACHPVYIDAATKVQPSPSPSPPTGWDTGLSQDYCKGLGQWLANRPGARQQLREMLAADHVEDVRTMVPMTDDEIDDSLPGGIIDCLLDPWDGGVGDGDESRSVKNDCRRIARAIEAHHGIK